jgi:exonuclease III
MMALIQTIKKENPDVICLQEVLSTQYDDIKKDINYEHNFPNKITGSYGCVTFSKYPITKSKCIRLPSNMNRSLILTQINDIVIGNVHFESEFSNINNTKLLQYYYVSTLLNKLYNDYGKVILCADTNVMKTEENIFNKYFNKLSDSWSVRKSSNDEYTYDFVTNKNLRLKNLKIRSRIDRILYQTLELTDFKLLRCKECDIQPSDHHGIMSTFYVT